MKFEPDFNVYGGMPNSDGWLVILTGIQLALFWMVVLLGGFEIFLYLAEWLWFFMPTIIWWIVKFIKK